MKKRRIDRDIVVLLVTTLITLVSWLGFEIYRAYAKPDVPEVLQKHLQSFDPTLDLSILDQIQGRLP